MLAPLETLIRARAGDLYQRTRPQYLQEVHFSAARRALGELAGTEQVKRGVIAMGHVR